MSAREWQAWACLAIPMTITIAAAIWVGTHGGYITYFGN